MDLTILLVSFFGAIIVSGVCSLFEAVLYSVRATYIEELVRQGRRSGGILKRLREDVQRPIAAILILNTVANTAGASVAGWAFGQAFESVSVGLFTGLFVFCILMFSEILPKTIGVVHAQRLAPVVAYPLCALVWVLTPLVWMTRLMTRLIGRDSGQQGPDEIEAMATLALRSGEIDPLEREVIGNILRLDQKSVADVITPRTVVFSVAEDATVSGARGQSWSYSRVPVYRKERDEVVGVLMRRDVFTALAEDRDETFGSLMRPLHIVPESARLHRVFHEFLQRREHLFQVVDEFGAFAGIVTLEDVLEEILGCEIVDEMDSAVDMQALARRSRPQARSSDEKRGP